MSKQLSLAIAGSAVLGVLFLLELSTGSLVISFKSVWFALWGDRTADEHLIVTAIRLPRALIALVVGAGMGVAGACLQALTRNPLASPELLGVNQGAALAIVIAMFALPDSPIWTYNLVSFAGGALASSFIFALSSTGRRLPSPMRFIVAGCAISLFLHSLTQGVLVLNERSLDEMRFWLAGSVSGRGMEQLLPTLPVLAIGLFAALALGKRMNTLQLGDETASGLGENVGGSKRLTFFTAVLLTAGCVTLAGPIAFIGLAVPHLVRSIAGPDYRWIIVHSIWLGASLLLAADVLGKLVRHPGEVPVGVMTILLGAPFFIHAARKKEVKAE